MSSQLLVYSQMGSYKRISSNNLSIMKNTIDLGPIYESSSQEARENDESRNLQEHEIKNNGSSMSNYQHETKESDAFSYKIEVDDVQKNKDKN